MRAPDVAISVRVNPSNITFSCLQLPIDQLIVALLKIQQICSKLARRG